MHILHPDMITWNVIGLDFRIELLILILYSHNQILELDYENPYENPKSHLITCER